MVIHISEKIIWRRQAGTAGIAGYGESTLCPGEAQARGFEHGHDKQTAIPKGRLIQYHDLETECVRPGKEPTGTPAPNKGDTIERTPVTAEGSSACDAPPLEDKEVQMLRAMEAHNQRLITYATSRQYESSILPSRQLGLKLPPSPFSARQQQHSRYDGQYEADDTTQRELVNIVEEEPSAHIAREARQAAADARPAANAYSHVPLTGNSLTLLPAYQLTQNLGKHY